MEEIIMKKSFKLVGLDCANCAAKIETAVQKITGVQTATVSFMTTKMTIEAEREDMPAIVEQAKAVVKKLEPDVEMVKA
ncbi:MAG: heavy metal transporter [Clostridiales bacterium]|nr:heavy metal transporter [Clostridiales bacterium]